MTLQELLKIAEAFHQAMAYAVETEARCIVAEQERDELDAMVADLQAEIADLEDMI